MASPVKLAKQQLRSAIKARLKELSPEAVATQSRCILNTLTNYKPYQDAKRISVYLSMPSAEVDTDAIVRNALLAGKQVFVPYIYKSNLGIPDTPSRIMDMVKLRDMEDYTSLERDSWGIPSIDPATVPSRQRVLGDAEANGDSTLDLVIVPGVGFDLDNSGHIRRLGHGKGFYDFFLNRYFGRDGVMKGTPQTLALAFKEQWLDQAKGEEVPMGEFDRKLDGIITGDGQVRISPA